MHESSLSPAWAPLPRGGLSHQREPGLLYSNMNPKTSPNPPGEQIRLDEACVCVKEMAAACSALQDRDGGGGITRGE